ncbi:MAG: nucleoside hydrolase [Caldilineaceae bacterium]|nr:nucleoside hydrolase [Caldilineaceae bacterium]
MKRIILDCDPGIDDSLAILFALKSPALQVDAVTAVSGNLPAERAAANILKTLDIIDAPPIPVAVGMNKPLVRPYPADPFSHGEDGLGETGLPASARPLDARFAPDLLVDMVNEAPGEITILASGPLTNIALAVMKDPSFAQKVKHIYFLGGAYGFNEYAYTFATGDNPVSEWNVYVDPEAARQVFHSSIPFTAIGGDVFAHPDINLHETHVEMLRAAGNRESRYMLDLLNFVTGRGFLSYCILIDSLCVAAALDEAVLQTRQIHVDVETRGALTLGQTVVDTRANFRWSHLPRIEAAYSADFEKFLRLLVETIAA